MEDPIVLQHLRIIARRPDSQTEPCLLHRIGNVLMMRKLGNRVAEEGLLFLGSEMGSKLGGTRCGGGKVVGRSLLGWTSPLRLQILEGDDEAASSHI